MKQGFRIPLRERHVPTILKAQAEKEGTRPYLTFNGRTWSFQDTYERVVAVARGFRSLNVHKGDTIAMFVNNCDHFVMSWYACTFVGAVIVQMNPTHSHSLLEYVLEDSRISGIVVQRELVPALATLSPQALDRIKWVAVIGGMQGVDLPPGPGRYVDYADLVIATGDDPLVATDHRDNQLIGYTSGTTGPSKGVPFTNARMLALAATWIRIIGLTRDDVLFTSMSVYHGVATRLGLLPALVAGTHVHLAEKFSASRYWQQVTECGATIGHCMFTIPAILKAQPPGAYDRAHKLRAMYNANYDAEFEERFNVKLIEAYGATEIGLPIHTEWPDRRPGASGRCDPDWEIQLVDEDGMPVPDETPGLVLARPKVPWLIMEGYLNKPDETVRTWRDLWYHTGDYMRRDADGYYYFIGRMKERIRRRGENLSAFEMERIVGAHPEVAECAFVGHPSPYGEDDIRCIVKRGPGSTLSAEQLMDWLQPRMPNAMLPRYIEFRATLPRTPSEKVEKYKLIAEGLPSDAWDREAVGYRTAHDRARDAAARGDRPPASGASAS